MALRRVAAKNQVIERLLDYGRAVDIGADESDGTPWSVVGARYHVKPTGNDAARAVAGDRIAGRRQSRASASGLAAL